MLMLKFPESEDGRYRWTILAFPAFSPSVKLFHSLRSLLDYSSSVLYTHCVDSTALYCPIIPGYTIGLHPARSPFDTSVALLAEYYLLRSHGT
jgi:hypothetical protein